MAIATASPISRYRYGVNIWPRSKHCNLSTYTTTTRRSCYPNIFFPSRRRAINPSSICPSSPCSTIASPCPETLRRTINVPGDIRWYGTRPLLSSCFFLNGVSPSKSAFGRIPGLQRGLDHIHGDRPTSRSYSGEPSGIVSVRTIVGMIRRLSNFCYYYRYPAYLTLH